MTLSQHDRLRIIADQDYAKIEFEIRELKALLDGALLTIDSLHAQTRALVERLARG